MRKRKSKDKDALVARLTVNSSPYGNPLCIECSREWGEQRLGITTVALDERCYDCGALFWSKDEIHPTSTLDEWLKSLPRDDYRI